MTLLLPSARPYVISHVYFPSARPSLSHHVIHLTLFWLAWPFLSHDIMLGGLVWVPIDHDFIFWGDLSFYSIYYGRWALFYGSLTTSWWREHYFIILSWDVDDYYTIVDMVSPSSMEWWLISPIILFVRGENYLYLYIVFIHPWYLCWYFNRLMFFYN